MEDHSTQFEFGADDECIFASDDFDFEDEGVIAEEAVKLGGVAPVSARSETDLGSAMNG